jgi:hypothetical protein
MHHQSNTPSKQWLLFGPYAVFSYVAWISTAFFPNSKPRTGFAKGVTDLVGLNRLFYVLTPCLLGGSAAFLAYLVYEKKASHRRWFSKKNLDQSLIHVGFIMITIFLFAVAQS